MMVVLSGSRDRPSWADIYAQHGKTMRAVAHAMLRGTTVDGKSADDIVSEVLTELISKGEPAMDNPRSYLCGAVRNRVNSAKRRHARVDRNEPDTDRTPGQEDVEDDVELRVLAAAATEALQDVPERERYAIEQRIMLDRPAHEVGAELGVEGQRVSQLYNAGLRRICKSPSFRTTASRDPSFTGAPPAPASETSP